MKISASNPIIIIGIVVAIAIAGVGGWLLARQATTPVAPAAVVIKPTPSAPAKTRITKVTPAPTKTVIVTPAPTVTVQAPAPSAPQMTNCNGGTDMADSIYAGPDTSCPFALNVAAIYTGPGVEYAYSPVTGETYAMTCEIVGAGTVECTG